MATYDDGFDPRPDEARDVLTDDGFPEHGASENVTDRPIGRLPHLLQLELCAQQATSANTVVFQTKWLRHLR